MRKNFCRTDKKLTKKNEKCYSRLDNNPLRCDCSQSINRSINWLKSKLINLQETHPATCLDQHSEEHVISETEFHCRDGSVATGKDS